MRDLGRHHRGLLVDELHSPGGNPRRPLRCLGHARKHEAHLPLSLRAGAKAKNATAEDEKKQEAIDLVLETIEALFSERSAEENIWGSMVKQTLKRQRPGFNESYYGFRSFSRLLEEAASRGLIEVEEDEKSGGVIIRSFKS